MVLARWNSQLEPEGISRPRWHFFDETYNCSMHGLASSGNGAHNCDGWRSETNVAVELSYAGPGAGHSICDGGRWRVFETPHRTAYAYNLHVEDVGHTLVLGATGSGKSFLLNFLVTHAQKYEPLTVILDLGHSYRKLATLLEGQYLEVGLRQSGVVINPFALDPPEHLLFFTRRPRVAETKTAIGSTRGREL